ncbi:MULTISPECIES: glycosyltransferase family 4 protein [Sphingomonas]|uniref:glycosyltransferase family 4 protein n=1 Tax=Sphingomonas TaxID=13687 RepID=UPI000DEEAE35|nr:MULTISPECIES: glycosyltransferase family 1 protein [Sphingomonas]
MLLLDVSRLIWRRWSGRLPTGIDRVCLAYVEQFGANALAVVQQGNMRRILDERSSQALFERLRQPGQDFRSAFARLVVRTAPGWLVGRSMRGARYLNVGHTGLDTPHLAPWIAREGLKAVYFIHDLIPITHPEYCRPGEEARHRLRMRTVLDSAAGVVANSEDTLRSLSAYAGEVGATVPPMVAAPLGSDLRALPRRNDAVAARPTFVVVGTVEGRKNHLLLLQIWDRLARALGDETPRLVIIGQRGWESEQAADLLDRARSLKPYVTELGRCSDRELADHLAGARALLFPSFVEGYGLPLIEALHQGTPVIASDLPVFREIGGDIPDYLDPLDGPAWRQTIMAYAASPSPERDAQLVRLSNYRVPTWAEHFRIVEPFLDTL